MNLYQLCIIVQLVDLFNILKHITNIEGNFLFYRSYVPVLELTQQPMADFWFLLTDESGKDKSIKEASSVLVIFDSQV